MPNQSKGIAVAVAGVVVLIGVAIVVGRVLLLAGGPHELPYPAVIDTHPDPTVFKTVVGQPTPGLDLGKMFEVTPPVLAHGKQLFDVNCVMCHGAAGKGDGVAAPALTPRPRDFSSPKGWTAGFTIANIYATLSDGVKGTGMPAFDALSPPDRFAVAHYVQSLGSFDHHDNQIAEIKAIDARYHLGEGPVGPSKVAVPTIMKHMAAEYAAPPAVAMPPVSDMSIPAELRRTMIVDAVRAAEVLSQVPDWRSSVDDFARVAMAAPPDNGFRPAVAALTMAQWKAFHDELVKLTPVPDTGAVGTQKE
ncbi:MAG: cytochrome c [Gemmatimonadaceae bacterium]